MLKYMEANVNHPLVSVIIPIYNAGEYLSQCIESVLSQSFHRFELVLVNDGSTDNSADLCNAYALIDYRVKVIHQTNCGVASARNAGINASGAEYIAFVDSDDFCDELMLEKLYSIVDKSRADFGVAGYKYYYNENKKIEQTLDATGVYSMVDFINEYFEEAFLKNILSGPCCKIFRREIILKHNLRYPAEYSIGEDGIFSYGYLNHCSTIAVLKDALYFYRQREDSKHLMSSYHANAFEALNCYYQSIADLLCNYKPPQSVVEMIDKAFLSRLLHCLGQVYSPANTLVINQYEEMLRQIESTFFQKLLKKSRFEKEKAKEAILVFLLRLKLYRVVDFYWKRRKGNQGNRAMNVAE